MMLTISACLEVLERRRDLIAAAISSLRALEAADNLRYADHGVTDHEAKAMTGLEINVINARRNELKAVKVGRRRGPKGVTVTAWALPDGAA